MQSVYVEQPGLQELGYLVHCVLDALHERVVVLLSLIAIRHVEDDATSSSGTLRQLGA
jgi:hypothetical protein